MSPSRTTESLSLVAPSTETIPCAKPRRSAAYHAWLVLFFASKVATLVLLYQQHYSWALAVLLLPAPWYTFQILSPSASALGPVVNRFATTRREVWLTIDDGPDPESTPKLLDQLDAHDARATFFLIGEKVLRHPALAKEILRRGHTIGNHTQTHPCNWFWCLTAHKTAREIDACADALRQIGADTTPWFRSPVGLKNNSLHRLLAQRGLEFVLWSHRGFDTTRRSPAQVLQRLTAKLQPGAILLVHESTPHAAQRTDFCPLLFAHLAMEGYRCVLPPKEALIRNG